MAEETEMGTAATCVLLSFFRSACMNGRVGSAYGYHWQRPRFDPEPRHLPAHRVTRMLSVRAASLGSNHALSTPCAIHGNNIHSERSGAHDCIDGKGSRLVIALARWCEAGVRVYKHVYLPRGAEWAQRQRWTLQQRAF